MFGVSSRVKTAITAICMLALAGCSAVYRNHGYVPSDDELQQIAVGVDTRATVSDLVGVPSAAGVLNVSGFYYVQSRVRHFGFQRPEVVDRQVVAISFDEGEVVSNVERFTLKDGQVVPLSRRVTSSSVENKGFLRQLLGNLGRFSASNYLN